FDLEAKMPKKSFKQAEPQDFLFKASVNIDIPKQMIHQAVSQSLMIANQSDAENQAQKWLNQMVANSNGLLVEDTQAYKSNIVFDNNKLVVNGVVQNFNDLGKPPALPEHKPTPNNPAQDL
ncbi:MAG: DUF945 family protein, partial [Neisseriaceae bacterium]|nr:DUF945 family protein [Neisseriaceae bacterium]